MSTRHPGGLLGFVRNLMPPADGSDADLLATFVAARDADAFAALVQRHAGMVQAVCRRRLGDGPDADDAVQAVFVALARDAGKLRGRDSLPGWLYRVAYLVSLKAAGRAAKRRAGELTEEAAVADPTPLPSEARELRDALDAELAELPDKFRSVVVLCLVEGRTNSEAAAALGVPVGTVDSRLSTARRTLQSRLVRRGVAVGVAAGFEAAVPRAGAAAAVSQLVQIALTADAVPAGVSELLQGVPTMTTAKAKLVAGGLIALGLVGGTGAGVWYAGADDKKGEKVAETKPADPPATTTVSGTLTLNGNGTGKLAVTTGTGTLPLSTLVSAETKKTMDVLNEIVKLEQELDGLEMKDLLTQLGKDHGVEFRMDEHAYRAQGEAAILSKKAVVKARPTGMTVAEVIRAALGEGAAEGGHQVIGFVVNGKTIEVRPSHIPNLSDADDPTQTARSSPSVTYAAEDKPLADVLADLRKHTRASIVLDVRAKDAGKTLMSGVFNDERLYHVLTVYADMAGLKLKMVGNVYYLTGSTGG